MMFDCINKACKMADMVLRAIRTTGNVSVNLSLNIFDKQVSPTVLYGCAIRATTKSHNIHVSYSYKQNEGVNALSIGKYVCFPLYINLLCDCLCYFIMVC